MGGFVGDKEDFVGDTGLNWEPVEVHESARTEQELWELNFAHTSACPGLYWAVQTGHDCTSPGRRT